MYSYTLINGEAKRDYVSTQSYDELHRVSIGQMFVVVELPGDNLVYRKKSLEVEVNNEYTNYVFYLYRKIDEDKEKDHLSMIIVTHDMENNVVVNVIESPYVIEIKIDDYKIHNTYFKKS